MSEDSQVTLNLQRICRTQSKLLACLIRQIVIKQTYMWLTDLAVESNCDRVRQRWQCQHCVCVCVSGGVKPRHMAIISISGGGSDSPAERHTKWPKLWIERGDKDTERVCATVDSWREVWPCQIHRYGCKIEETYDVLYGLWNSC